MQRAETAPGATAVLFAPAPDAATAALGARAAFAGTLLAGMAGAAATTAGAAQLVKAPVADRQRCPAAALATGAVAPPP